MKNVKKDRIDKVRYHWYSYTARGGLNTPRMSVGRLEAGGLHHWSTFLQLSRGYMKDFPNERHELDAFVPRGIMRLILGE